MGLSFWVGGPLLKPTIKVLIVVEVVQFFAAIQVEGDFWDKQVRGIVVIVYLNVPYCTVRSEDIFFDVVLRCGPVDGFAGRNIFGLRL